MKFIVNLVLTSFLIFSCHPKKNTTSEDIKDFQDPKEVVEKSVVIPEKKSTIELEGFEFFSSIKDTINIQPIDADILTESVWIFKPFNKCLSKIRFIHMGKGIYYNCEIPDQFEIQYHIEADTIHIEQYETPNNDNPDLKKIKSRDDYYVYTGKSLVMIGSQMHNPAGKTWIPKINTIIEYQQQDGYEYESGLNLNNEFIDYRQFELSQTIIADFNGDHFKDTAEFVLINNKGGILITHGKSNDKIMIAGGKALNGEIDDLSWADYWAVTRDNETFEIQIIDSEIIGAERFVLENPSIILRKNEVGGGIVTYKNGSYRWVHQAD